MQFRQFLFSQNILKALARFGDAVILLHLVQSTKHGSERRPYLVFSYSFVPGSLEKRVVPGVLVTNVDSRHHAESRPA